MADKKDKEEVCEELALDLMIRMDMPKRPRQPNKMKQYGRRRGGIKLKSFKENLTDPGVYIAGVDCSEGIAISKSDLGVVINESEAHFTSQAPVNEIELDIVLSEVPALPPSSSETPKSVQDLYETLKKAKARRCKTKKSFSKKR